MSVYYVHMVSRKSYFEQKVQNLLVAAFTRPPIFESCIFFLILIIKSDEFYHFILWPAFIEKLSFLLLFFLKQMIW